MSANTPSSDEFQVGDIEDPSSTPRKIPSIASLFHILWLRKWVAVVIWLVVAIPTGVTLSIFNLPRSYSATTVIRFPQVIGAQTNVMRDVAITEGQSIIAILNSFQVLDGTIRKLGLRLRIVTPEMFQRWVFKSVKFGESMGPGIYKVEIGNRGASATIGYKPPDGTTEYKIYSGPVENGRVSAQGLEMEFASEFLSGLHGNRVDLELEPFDATFRDLKKAMAARSLGGGNFEIRLKDRDPWLVAEILSTLQAQFLDIYYGTTEVQDVGILVQMEKDLALAKERLEKSQDELSHYFAEHPELSDQGNGQGDNLAYLDARQQSENLQAQRRRVQEAFGAREPGGSPDKEYFWALELLNAMGEAGEPKANILRSSLQEMNLRQQGFQKALGPDHPKIAEVEAEKRTIYRQIEETETAILRRLDKEIGDYKVRMASSAPRGNVRPAVKVQLELERLSNVNKNNQNIYDRLLESYNRAKLVTGSEFFKVSVVDPARPALYEPPSHKTRLLIAGTAMLLLLLVIPSLVLAWSLVFIRIWTKEDVRRLLGLKTLGVLAERKPKRAKAKPDPDAKVPDVDPMLLVHGERSQLEDIESYRLVREEIENGFRNPAAPGRFCLMVTSSRPHEGKSTCAANLAVTFARKGKRTLLVDADFRLGRMARIFGLSVSTGIDTILDQQELDLTQFLESATLVFQPTLQRNLVLAPRKSSNANASELISADRFKAFLRMAREQFDVVIIDTPPVMITPEPLSLAESADGIIFVCRSGMTSASEARDAVEFLRERNPRIAAILNGSKTSPFEANRYKKYSYYYQVQPAPETEPG
jgi:capsular exopolysaccharide synthesis family protein